MIGTRANFGPKRYLANPLVRFNLFFGLLLNILIWLLIAWKVADFSDVIILHYNIYFGIDLIGNWYQLFWLPLVGSAIILINFSAAAPFFVKEKIISLFLVFSSSLAQILIFLATWFLIVINIS